MDVHRLRVLRAVVADGSIQGAATNLGYTPSAISQHLSALQRETGLKLVQRSGRGIEPTVAGRAVAAEAARIFERLADLESLVTDLRAGRAGSLSVKYFASAGAVWIPPVVACIAREFPRLRLDLRLIELVAADAGAPDVEIAVDGAESTDNAGYRVYPLLTEPYFAVVPAACELAGRAEVDLAELRDENWVDNDVARGPCRQAVLDACSTVGFVPAFHIETQDYPTAIRFVAEGIGITVIPYLGLDLLPASTVAVPIVNPTPRRSISVRVREAVADHPAVVRILELLDERVAGDRRKIGGRRLEGVRTG
ncbi:LysR family transcriptional regulator [Pseudonocardia spinosispora]|uniref:LysR family transcriptional regulator n=1 Tax=Pseudonocardia spinosispora TaxID=103441 RepID=UPI00068685D8|nr:LysR family transcriptional regulator [Pseudonocardia spinosispora]